jgi:adenosine deaminase
LAVIIAAARVFVVACHFGTVVTAQTFDGLRDDHPALRAFLYRMPKGGDLHVHLSGAAYAERLIDWAAQQGLCVRLSDWFFVDGPCTGDKPAVAEIMRDQRKFDTMLNAMSMRFFLPSAAVPSRHDQFFSTFAKFSEITWRVTPEMTVDMLTRYGAKSGQYAEFMLSFSTREERAALIAAIRGQSDFAAMLETLKQNGLDALVARRVPK